MLIKLQSPEGDWADCDAWARRLAEAGRGLLLLQSPEGDWADCDAVNVRPLRPVRLWRGCNPPKGIGLIATTAAAPRPTSHARQSPLQSPEGDWADCDGRSAVSGPARRKGVVAIPRRGLG